MPSCWIVWFVVLLVTLIVASRVFVPATAKVIETFPQEKVSRQVFGSRGSRPWVNGGAFAAVVTPSASVNQTPITVSVVP